jgi:ribosomal protein S3AE
MEKKKKFVIMGSKEVGNIELGETISEKPETVVNRRIKVNMGLALNQAKKKNIDLTFKIKNVQGSNALTEISGYEVKKSYLRRLLEKI